MEEIVVTILPAVEGRGPSKFSAQWKPQVLQVIKVLATLHGDGFLKNSGGYTILASDRVLEAGAYTFTVFSSKAPTFSR